MVMRRTQNSGWLVPLVGRFGKLANATQAAKMSPAMAHLSTLTATLRIMDVKAVARIVKTADIGLGEAFMLREIETDDLLSVMWVMSGNAKVSRLPPSPQLSHSTGSFTPSSLFASPTHKETLVLARQTTYGRESQENRPWVS
jgi:hypothetical protein